MGYCPPAYLRIEVCHYSWWSYRPWFCCSWAASSQFHTAFCFCSWSTVPITLAPVTFAWSPSSFSSLCFFHTPAPSLASRWSINTESGSMRAINTRCYWPGCGAGHTELQRKGSTLLHSIFTPCGISPSPGFRFLGSGPSSLSPAACSASQCPPSLIPVLCSDHTAPCTPFLIYLFSTLWCACRWGHFSGTNLGITCTREWVTPLPWTPHWARCIHRRRSRITSCCPPSPPPMRWSWLSTSCWSLLSCCISSAASWL